MIQGKKILITGGGGFIGSHLVEQLIEHNTVIVYDTFSRPALTPEVEGHTNLVKIKGDVLNPEQLEDAFKGVDIVVHMAAIAGAQTIQINPAKTFHINLMGTYNVLEAARKHNVSRFIDFSTSEVYGKFAENVSETDDTKQGPISEPRWNYAVSKLASEYLSHSYYKEYGLPVVSLRPFNIYGPRQVGEGAINNFVARAKANEELLIHGDGSQIRAWCYVEDMVQAILLAMEKDEAVGEAFNIGTPEASVTTLQLAESIIKVAGSSSTIKHKEIDYPDVETRIPKVDKAKKILGYAPKFGLEEGLKKTIQ